MVSQLFNQPQISLMPNPSDRKWSITVYKETRTKLLETPGGSTLRSAPPFFDKIFCKNVLNTEPAGN